MKRFLWESCVLIISFSFVFAWQQTALSQYTVPTLGLLIVLYLLISSRKKEFNPLQKNNNTGISVFILNTVVLLLIFSTGTFASPLFFLLYFLGFGIAFVFQPSTIFVFLLGTVLVLWPDMVKDDVMSNALRVGSVALISPLAFFFGKEFKERSKEDQEMQKLHETSEKTADQIESDAIQIEQEPLTSRQKAKVDDILKKTEDLRNQPD